MLQLCLGKRGLLYKFFYNCCSISNKGESIYAASKAGVETFSRSFAREMADFNVRVNCIAPGPIKTDLLRGISDQQIARITSQQIIPKLFEKTAVCDLVELLLDNKAACLSGQVLNLGGV